MKVKDKGGLVSTQNIVGKKVKEIADEEEDTIVNKVNAIIRTFLNTNHQKVFPLFLIITEKNKFMFFERKKIATQYASTYKVINGSTSRKKTITKRLLKINVFLQNNNYYYYYYYNCFSPSN